MLRVSKVLNLIIEDVLRRGKLVAQDHLEHVDRVRAAGIELERPTTPSCFQKYVVKLLAYLTGLKDASDQRRVCEGNHPRRPRYRQAFISLWWVL
jgi:hypothetical protein